MNDQERERASTTVQVSDGVRRNLAAIAAQRQDELGRSGRVPFSEVIEYLIEVYRLYKVQRNRETGEYQP